VNTILNNSILNSIVTDQNYSSIDPSQDFRPDCGTIDVFRMPGGMGIRLDGK
jgi:pyruvate carboxylase